MPPESWLVVLVAAAFLLLGIAASPLAWVALLQRRSRSERQSEQRFHDLAGQLRAVQRRLERCEASFKPRTAHGPSQPACAAREWPTRASTPWDAVGAGPLASSSAGGPDDPTLIAVPNLAAASQDRQAALNGLNQRYAAIWSLADTGAPPDVIARATGQPIGQIELILGLRRQINSGH
jgi:hypothetical protein